MMHMKKNDAYDFLDLNNNALIKVPTEPLNLPIALMKLNLLGNNIAVHFPHLSFLTWQEMIKKRLMRKVSVV
jgi:hypothetical protein